MRITFFSEEYISIVGDAGFKGGRDLFELTENVLMGKKEPTGGFQAKSMLDIVDFVLFMENQFRDIMEGLDSMEDLNGLFFGELSKMINPYFYYPGALYIAKAARNPSFPEIVQEALSKRHKWRGPEVRDREVALPIMLELLNNI